MYYVLNLLVSSLSADKTKFWNDVSKVLINGFVALIKLGLIPMLESSNQGPTMLYVQL